MATPVRLWFDFISPYSWLALRATEAFAERHGVVWQPRPVVYAKLLDASGLVGPAEVEVKRRYTWQDVGRAARLADLPFVGPPAHPFRSLDALRVQCLFAGDPRSLELAVALSAAAWEQGRDLTDPEVLATVVRDVGLEAAGLAERLAEPEVKRRLRENTDRALAAGVFGVPSFECDGALFWGHDRLPQLAAWLDGRLAGVGEAAERMAARPRGADRPGRP